MKRTIWITSLAFLCAIALCIVSNRSLTRVVNHARHMRTQAIDAADAGDLQRAGEALTQLAAYVKRNSRWMETLCEHDDLHDVKTQLINAQAGIEFGSLNDFYHAAYLLGEYLEHIAEAEDLRLSNLY